jgi:hypothetical protein
MWASGHNGEIKRAAYGYEATREAAMAALAVRATLSWKSTPKPDRDTDTSTASPQYKVFTFPLAFPPRWRSEPKFPELVSFCEVIRQARLPERA